MRAYNTRFSMNSDPASVPAARRRVDELTTGWGLSLDEDSTIALKTVVSEMVTNALQHSGGREFTIRLRASSAARRIVVEVRDDSAVLPRMLAPTDDAEDGRGMWLIQQLALASGAEHTRRGKRVWATIAIPEQPLSCRQFLLRPGRVARAVTARLTGPRRRPISADAHTS
ncbi:ATP-binding protein [Streptomyces sp. NBC_01198]|uniref:ATP-binding protein n=1 Tax=Streptomyces sp. NBC_01198 TaxID=2903769 RepID=UPI002E0EBA90|nr:ATP-binding protein [Streptomyces sp. NBC_01198]